MICQINITSCFSLCQTCTPGKEGTPQNKSFTIQVKIDDIVYGEGTARTKKEAEQEAAKCALSKLVTK